MTQRLQGLKQYLEAFVMFGGQNAHNVCIGQQPGSRARGDGHIEVETSRWWRGVSGVQLLSGRICGVRFCQETKSL